MDFEAPSVTARVSGTEVSPYGKRSAGLVEIGLSPFSGA